MNPINPNQVDELKLVESHPIELYTEERFIEFKQHNQIPNFLVVWAQKVIEQFKSTKG